MVFQLPIAASKPHQNLVAWNNHHLIISVIFVDRECEQDSAGWVFCSSSIDSGQAGIQSMAGLMWGSSVGFTHLPGNLAKRPGSSSPLVLPPLHVDAGPLHEISLLGWLDFSPGGSRLQETKGQSCWSYWKLGIMHWLVKNGYRQLVFKRRKIESLLTEEGSKNLCPFLILHRWHTPLRWLFVSLFV